MSSLFIRSHPKGHLVWMRRWKCRCCSGWACDCDAAAAAGENIGDVAPKTSFNTLWSIISYIFGAARALHAAERVLTFTQHFHMTVKHLQQPHSATSLHTINMQLAQVSSTLLLYRTLLPACSGIFYPRNRACFSVTRFISSQLCRLIVLFWNTLPVYVNTFCA